VVPHLLLSKVRLAVIDSVIPVNVPRWDADGGTIGSDDGILRSAGIGGM
jgi:hypothetical protein